LQLRIPREYLPTAQYQYCIDADLSNIDFL
jgi:hypothetical protein